ncbi:MAG: pseudouridine-5'-phosphate glycosidase [Bacteroidetes bacterium]|nr:pseudouridine-5'-phosphate glycosidase [Bacteroidota bacterium]
MNEQTFLNISTEVRDALVSGKPVVALESTIIAHGMPYPKNIQTALEVESMIKNNGAVPATIAILDGKCCVGLNEEQLTALGKSKEVWKVSLRDIPYVISNKLPGATTVAATMRIAHMAGIRIFVTGGIGGVHRGAETSMDVSADLTEMSQTSVAVISAGVKSILDIGLTLEYLETKGIPVVTVGQDTFPSFYSRESGFTSPLRIDDPGKIADLIRVKWQLGLIGAVLVANPVPAKSEIPFSKMEIFIHDALSSAKKNNISGKKLTPFLLQYISEKTGGESLEANIALVKNNALLGARIATAL